MNSTPNIGGSYQPQIDGLRAISVLGVLLHHFGFVYPYFLNLGTLPVRTFFALTGYFVTMWVWRAIEVAKKNRVSPWRELPVFHARRLLRIIPPLYLSLVIASAFSIASVKEDILWHALFTSNFYVVHIGYWPPAISHLWSLSVQEQYYLIWPVIILATPRKWFIPIVLIIIMLAFSYRMICYTHEISPFVRWTMLPGSLDSFSIGALVAWLGRGQVGSVMTSRFRMGIIGLLAFGCLLVGRYIRDGDFGHFWTSSVELWEAVFIGWIIASTSQGWHGVIGKVLSLPALVYLGKISLGIYLFHVLVHIITGPHLDKLGITPDGRNNLRIIVLMAITIAVASISWHLLEKPLGRLKPSLIKKNHRTQKTITR